jgi:hypothetical protein
VEKQPALKLCTFEVATHLGRQRRLGVWIDERIVDLNFATAWYMAQTGEAEPQRLADALVPGNMLDFLRAGLRAIHTAEDLFSGAGPHPARWWMLDADAPRGPNDETLVYAPDQVRLCALLGGRHTAGPEDQVPAGEYRPKIAAVIGAIGLVGFTLANESNCLRAVGPYLGRPHDLSPESSMVIRINGAVRGRTQFRADVKAQGSPGDIVGNSDIVVAVQAGDVIELEMEGLGVLRNQVTQPQPAGSHMGINIYPY